MTTVPPWFAAIAHSSCKQRGLEVVDIVASPQGAVMSIVRACEADSSRETGPYSINFAREIVYAEESAPGEAAIAIEASVAKAEKMLFRNSDRWSTEPRPRGVVS